MSDTYDVIVVGVGAMGSATCSELARRGLKVAGIERFDIPHIFGSSGGQTRSIRKAYTRHPDYVQLLHRAYENWDSLHERTGVQVLYRNGLLYLGRNDAPLIQGTREVAQQNNLAIEELSLDEVNRRYGVFECPENWTGLLETDAGFILNELAVATFTEEALRHGAEIRARERVVSWQADSDGVTLQTDKDELDAGHVIFTAGAWSPRLLGPIGVSMQVTRQVLAWVWPTEQPEAFAYDRLPCWEIDPDDSFQEQYGALFPAGQFKGFYYGFPILPGDQFAGERGFKLAHNFIGLPIEPEQLSRQALLEDELDFRPCLERYIPKANGPTLATKICMYTASPDENFILDRHPEHDTITIGCGFSGHGFKFASVIGEALADLATEGQSALPIDFLGLGRFA